MTVIKDAMKEMESVMTNSSVERSDEIYKREMLLLKLSDLREQFQYKQTDIKGFSQPAVSRIEGRTDIKLSTLVKYITQMDLDLEIKVRPKKPKKGMPKEVLLFQT